MFLYMVAMLAVCALSFWAYLSRPRNYADLMGVSVLLLVVFVVQNLIVVFFEFPDAILASPVLDLALAMMIYRSWRENRERWKVVVTATLVAQLMLHVAVIAVWRGEDLTQRGLYLYVVAVNAFFILQLLTLGSVGAGHGLGRLRHWLLNRGRDSLVPHGRR
jgi:multisubunit Na+/H+ antiporter MnhF subunit